jgi:hypothetical protein
MAIKTTGPLGLNSDIIAEFGEAAPHSLSEYYKGSARVPNVAANNKIPFSGEISFSDFYGGTKFIPPTYSIAIVNPSSNVIPEGGSGTYRVNTTNVGNGTVLYWNITNLTTSNSDFTVRSGTIAINNNTGTFTISAVADLTTEGQEAFTVNIRTGSTSGPRVTSTSTTIGDTSTTPPPQPVTTSIAIPAFSTFDFSAGDRVVTHRLLGTFTLPRAATLSIATPVTIRGDEREPNKITSTNTMLVRNPTISIYRGGTVSSGSSLTAPTGALVASGTSFVENQTDNFYTNTEIFVGPSPIQTRITTYYVVASMYCERIGGPDARQARWINPEFFVAVTG